MRVGVAISSFPTNRRPSLALANGLRYVHQTPHNHKLNPALSGKTLEDLHTVERDDPSCALHREKTSPGR